MVSSRGGSPPDPEVTERSRRRRFTAHYKLRILEEADRCAPGGQGALLRREGLYASHLTAWRKQRQRGGLEALTGKRGRQARHTPEQREIARLEKDNAALRRELENKDLIVEVHRKRLGRGRPMEPGRSQRMKAVAELRAGRVSVLKACAAVSIPRASYYRSHHAAPVRPKPRPRAP